MSDFKEFFDALQESVEENEFVKLTLSKPIRKSEGLLNVYVRLQIIDNKEVFIIKYRYSETNSFTQCTIDETKVLLEKLLLASFRTATLFTLGYDLLVKVSKNKQVSCIDTAPSFKNKLPEHLEQE